MKGRKNRGNRFSHMDKFGPSVFYLFGPSVKNLVLRFSIYSVLRIRSSVPVRIILVKMSTFLLKTLETDVFTKQIDILN